MPTTDRTLPDDAARATLVGRVWLPGPLAGPSVVVVRGGELFDITAVAPTVAALLASADPVATARTASGEPLGALADWLAQTRRHGADPLERHLLAPNDLQVVKAAGVTFAASMVERVIEEQARGDPAAAAAVRELVVAAVGDDLSRLRPASSTSIRTARNADS